MEFGGNFTAGWNPQSIAPPVFSWADRIGIAIVFLGVFVIVYWIIPWAGGGENNEKEI